MEIKKTRRTSFIVSEFGSVRILSRSLVRILPNSLLRSTTFHRENVHFEAPLYPPLWKVWTLQGFRVSGFPTGLDFEPWFSGAQDFCFPKRWSLRALEPWAAHATWTPSVQRHHVRRSGYRSPGLPAADPPPRRILTCRFTGIQLPDSPSVPAYSTAH
jgi:hypothetical protein